MAVGWHSVCGALAALVVRESEPTRARVEAARTLGRFGGLDELRTISPCCTTHGAVNWHVQRAARRAIDEISARTEGTAAMETVVQFGDEAALSDKSAYALEALLKRLSQIYGERSRQTYRQQRTAAADADGGLDEIAAAEADDEERGGGEGDDAVAG
jgi:hypothetical protein